MQSLETVFQNITSEFEAAQCQAAESARAKAADELNQVARRLDQYRAESDWNDAVLDGAARFASEVALFAFEDGVFLLKGARNFALSPDLRIPAGDANAFRSTLDTGETNVILCTTNEVSSAISAAVSADRAIVVPISNGSRRVALLFATATQQADTNALELIAHIASAALECHSRTAAHIQIAPVPSKPAAPLNHLKDGTRADNQLPRWTGLPDAEKLLHVRAKRLARAKVAEMRLYRPEACQMGHARRDIYFFLKQEIDSARQMFRNQFMSTTAMIDYLHIELLGQLAENDEAFLGADYPGQMV
ncbi:MAG: hypothetical protein WAM39_31975 [Bryobacteraceae bacterium]